VITFWRVLFVLQFWGAVVGIVAGGGWPAAQVVAVASVGLVACETYALLAYGPAPARHQPAGPPPLRRD